MRFRTLMTVQAPSWQKNPLLQGLSPEELLNIESLMVDVSFEKGATLLIEGSQGDSFFFLISGSVEVLKEGFSIAILEAGDVVGEQAILKEGLRIATIRALEPTHTKKLRIRDLPTAVLQKISHNLLYLFSARLSATNVLTAQALRRDLFQTRKRLFLSRMTIRIILGVVLYIVLMSFYVQLFPIPYSAFFSIFYMSIFAGYTCRTVIQDGYSLSLFGLTLRNWKKSIQETLIFMIPVFLTILVIKQALILFSPYFANQPLFHFGLELPAATPEERFWLIGAMIIYLLGIPIQELIFRGILQNSWQRFALGPHRTAMAIFASTLLYISVHFYWTFSLILVPPSILWGWLFARHRTLVGVAIGHLLIGLWTFYIVGIKI